jgi:5-hydroxyisourate hydrolase-like protein (transthyretin family)
MSAIGLAAVTIIAVSLVAAPILSGGTLPFWQGTTSSKTSATSTTGGVLSVQINIANDPISLGSVQSVTVTVLDQSGQPVPAATARLEATSPSGQMSVSERSTDPNGKCTIVFQIAASPNNVGTFQVKVSATKSGYETGQAQSTFQVTEAP